MLATSSVVDPLLTSPQRVRNHDDDMAELQNLQCLPPLELPPSVAEVSSSMSAYTSYHEAAPEQVEQEESAIEEEDAETQFDQLMNRGNYLRQLRLLALADEEERLAAQEEDNLNAYDFCEEKKEDEPTLSTFNSDENQVRILPNKDKLLNYNAYLSQQRYYDDLKHVDIKYMDFGNMINATTGESGGGLIVEQRKQLGKGGFCWDAGFILGEHVIAHEKEWGNGSSDDCEAPAPRVVELGAGTGLSGLMIAKATKSSVITTDLPELQDLMNENIERNFGSNADNNELHTNDGKAKGTITNQTLRWGVVEDYKDAPYDVIIGADIVTSLYDPVALAHAVHALSGPNTKIYISGKSRLDKPHEEFDEEMNRLFGRVEKIKPSSQLKSPDVFIIVAAGKR